MNSLCNSSRLIKRKCEWTLKQRFYYSFNIKRTHVSTDLIREFHCTQATKHPSEGIHPGFETQGRRHQISKIGVSVAPQKGLVSSEIFKKKKKEKKKGLTRTYSVAARIHGRKVVIRVIVRVVTTASAIGGATIRVAVSIPTKHAFLLLWTRSRTECQLEGLFTWTKSGSESEMFFGVCLFFFDFFRFHGHFPSVCTGSKGSFTLNDSVTVTVRQL